MKVLFCGAGDQAAAYAPALKRWSAELDAPFDLFTDPGDIAPGDVDVLIANPNAEVADFGVYAQVVQGGGITPEGQQKQTNAPIVLEADNGLRNDAYSLAMARMNQPDTATSQFYVNTANNDGLNGAYAVFGQVIAGTDTIDAIKVVQTGPNDVPVEDVVITDCERVE